MSTRLSAQVRAPIGRRAAELKSRRRGADTFLDGLDVLEGDMEFLTFLSDSVRNLNWKEPFVLFVAGSMALMAYFKRWLLIFLSLATLVAGKAVEYFYPEATGAFVADMTVVQVIYILGAVIVVITALGQMVLRH
jgi:hypothetical protein